MRTRAFEYKDTRSSLTFYRPHPKEGEGFVFTGVCPHLGVLSPRFFPRSLVPGPVQGYPSPGRVRGGHPIMGYPQPGQDGVTPRQVKMRYPQPVQGGVPPTRDRTAERALAMRREVCLMRSLSYSFLVSKSRNKLLISNICKVIYVST